jgi:lipopolysaccharide transport system ATP-binding protein/teichoic acid transport system ATP-binding protein
VSSLSVSEERVAVDPAVQASDDWAISVEDLSVVYRTTVERKPTLRNRLARLGRRQRIVREIQALREVTFTVPHGKVLGIVGVNGAGKSTLMRTVAGILPPTSGRVRVHGRVSTLLALGVGFNSDLSGRENVVLGGLAAGLSRDQLASKYDEIADFAELGPAMDLPMRRYSSGMYGRLAFSVAVNMEPDILLIDEALSVGDPRFRRKSFDKMRELCAQAGTILVVSHSLKNIRKLCDEIIWLHEGRLMMRGEPPEVIEAYRRFLDIGEADAGGDDD